MGVYRALVRKQFPDYFRTGIKTFSTAGTFIPNTSATMAQPDGGL